MLDIRYRYFNNPEHEKMVKHAVELMLHVIPWWVDTLYIDDAEPKGDAACSVTIEDSYRFATVNIHPPFYDSPRDKRLKFIAHELCHLLVGSLTNWVANHVIAPIEERNPELHEHIRREYRNRVESSVTDMALALLRGSGNE